MDNVADKETAVHSSRLVSGTSGMGPGRSPSEVSVNVHGPTDVERVEAPVTLKAYLLCAFASFGGVFFGYDAGYINGVNGLDIWIKLIEGPDAKALSSSNSSLIVSILSAGTFFGAIIAGDVAERIGRKWTGIMGCLIYIVGVIVQCLAGLAGDPLAAIVSGRLIAGFGVGFESAIIILYMSEIVSGAMSGKRDRGTARTDRG